MNRLVIVFLIALALCAPAAVAAEVLPAPAAGANSDSNYRALRDAALAETYRVENIALQRDVGTLTLKTGEISFIAPVLGRRPIAVFTGDARFRLDPALPVEGQHLELITGSKVFEEDLVSALLCFTDGTYEEIRGQSHAIAASAKNDSALQEYRGELRRRIEEPRSMVEYELFNAHVPNIEALLLLDLYNPGAPRSFTAFLHGRKHAHLRFLVQPNGAMPDMSPEEVALINLDLNEKQDGIWYLTHTAEEWAKHTASSNEDHRIGAPEHYRIDAQIGHKDHLGATVHIQFKARRDGDRVIPFNLLPNLRVAHVRITKGPKIGFIQESRKQDGSLYVVLPEPTEKNRSYEIDMDYEGDKVVHDEGNGNYAVGARENWYPSVSFNQDRATFDLSFLAPKHLTVVSIGKLVNQSRDGNQLLTEWKSDVPTPVAGFNCGDYKKKERIDETTNHHLEAYATGEAPDYLRAADGSNILSPSSMADNVLIDTLNSMRAFELWFGKLPYDRIAVTQQPAFNFGQSWPTLIYLPVSAFLDSTRRWQLLGRNAFKFGEFIDEVTAHEVSHQWWGHLVGFASYHDQWLSEGFADFSAGLFLQLTEKTPEKYHQYLETNRKDVVDRNAFGLRATEAGPLWLGERLITYKTENAYQALVYSKGGYVLHMLRYLMQGRDGDKAFIDMMHDFVGAYSNRSASTEQFQKVVEKHMTPEMDIDGNHSMAWFFKEWVYGTELPGYRLEYSLTDAPGGRTQFTGRISQSDVSQDFKMRVPLYADLDGRVVKLGGVPLAGTMTSNEIRFLLPKRPRRMLLNANYDILASSVTANQK